jgi:hypothetical protein
MNKKFSIFLLVLFIFVSLFSLTILATDYPYFVSCKDFIGLDNTEQLFYIIGASDVIDVSMVEAGFEKYYDFTKDLSPNDLLELFLDYLYKNPNYLFDEDESAAYVFFEMITVKVLSDVLK